MGGGAATFGGSLRWTLRIDNGRAGHADFGGGAGLGDFRHREDGQVPFGGTGRLDFAFEGSETAHFHLNGPFAVGQIGKQVGALGIGKYRVTVFSP